MIDYTLIKSLLGFKQDVPLTPRQMAHDLKVSFFPSSNQSVKQKFYVDKVKTIFRNINVKIEDYNDICYLDKKGRKRFKEGYVIFFCGADKDNNIPMDYIGSLSNNPIVSIIESEKSVSSEMNYLSRMHLGLSFFTRDMCHIVIALGNKSWRTYSYNGFSEEMHYKDLKDHVLNRLVPKLVTRVMPPRMHEFLLIKEKFDFIENKKLVPYVKDFIRSGITLAKRGLFFPVKNVNEFKYKKKLYRRITSQYLDERTGMSYGYMARQLPVDVSNLICEFKSLNNLNKIDTNLYENNKKEKFILFKYDKKRFWIKIPDIWVLMSRSGANKTRLNPVLDIIMVGIEGGVLKMRIPKSVNIDMNYRPSFDTKLILSHSLANALYAAVLNYFSPRKSRLASILSKTGLALLHWHGDLEKEFIPRGWYVYGENNPPVLCSSPQSSIYAFKGKERAALSSLNGDYEFIGDVHIEPQHGVNLVGPSLKRLSYFLFSSAKIN